MSIIWLLIVLVSCGVAVATNPDVAITAMLKGSHEAVRLAISLTAVYGFWLGFLNILESIGATNFFARVLSPVIKFLFPNASKQTKKYISVNMSANLLGLGNASTPMGIKAISSMDTGTKKATNNMIMLVVISATSLQLLPSTVIGMLVEHGSAQPTQFLVPCIVATVTSTIVGITLVKILGAILPKEQTKQ